MRFLLIVFAVALVACVSSTAPKGYCANAGDTTGLAPLIQTKDSVIVACLFTVEPVDKCRSTPILRFTRADCVEGTKWKG